MIHDDDRGVSTVIGAVFLLGVLVILLSVNQAVVVPDQNRGLEFNHNQEVRGQLSELRSAVVSSVGGADPRSVTLDLGLRYPPRVVAVNPGPATGQIRTIGTTDDAVTFGVENATALDSEVGDFWNGTERAYSTGALAYRPNYNVYDSAPETVYENSLLYDDFGERPLVRAGQALIDGDRLSLVALNGSLGRTSSAATTVDVQPLSASTRTVTVTNESAGSNITLTLPTRLDRSEWEEVLADERDAGTVVDVRSGTVAGSPLDAVVIELAPGTYRLQMAKTGVGSWTRGTDEAYFTDVDGQNASVPEDGTQRIVVEARDRFNNPVAGVDVTVATNGTGEIRPATAGPSANAGTAAMTADDEGRAAFVYVAPDNVDRGPQAARVNATFETGLSPSVPGFNRSTPENVTFDLTVRNTDGSGYATGGGGDGTGPVVTGQSVSPDPVSAGATVTLTATVDDRDRGGIDVVEAEWFRVAPGETIAGQDPGNGSANQMSVADGSWDQPVEGVDDTATADWVAGDHTIVFRGKDANGNWGDTSTTTVTVTEGALITAVEPDPELIADGDGEFVRLEIPSGLDTSGWELADSDGNTETLADLDGTVYVARDPSAFADQWDGVSPGDVVEFSFALNNGGDAVELRDDTGTVVDRFAYEGPTFDDGSTYSFADADYEGQVAYRTRSGGSFDDTDSASDWAEENECVFFGGGDGCSDTNPPVVQSASLPGTPIDDTEANSNNVQRTLSVTFNETMDTSVDPTFTFTNVGSSSVTQVAGTGGWADSTTYEVDLEFSDADVDESVDVLVDSAQDAAGNTMSQQTALTFTIDTQEPGGVNSVQIDPSTINRSNENAVDVTVQNPDTLYGDEEIVLTLHGADGGTVTATAAPTNGGGGDTVFTVDVSSLADGTVNASAYARDDVGNTGPELQNRDDTPKDTVAPSISSVSLSNDGSDNLDISFESDESLSDLTVTVTGPSTVDVYTFALGEFSESGSGPYTYELTTTQAFDDGDGTYTATVDDALDAAGNNGGENGVGSGLSDDYVHDTTAPSISSPTITDADSDGAVRDSDSVTISATVTDSASGVGTVEADASAFGAGTVTLTDGDGNDVYDATFTVGSGATEGAQFVTITATDTRSNADSADTGTLTVDTTAPSVTVDDPNGGEVVQGGSTYTVTWTATDSGSGIESNSVELEYSTNGGSTWNPIATGEPNDGSYDWSVPTAETSTALVRVSASDVADNTLSDTSDGTFTIDSTPPSISNFAATNPSGQDLQVSFDSDEGLSAISVTITDSDGNPVTTLDETDFTGSGSGTYTATYTVSLSGEYTATLDTAADAAGNDGASGETSTVLVNDPSAIQFNNFAGFEADSVNDEFTLQQLDVQDADNDDDLDRVEYVVTDSNGNVVATRTDSPIPSDQYQPTNQGPITITPNTGETVAEGETYTLTLTVYDADENFDDRSASDTTDTYSINSVSASSGGGNDISVTADISTSDPGAEIKVQSLRGGTVRDSTRVAVTNSQPQTEVISGANQADQVRVILYDSAGVEVGRQTIPYP